MNFCPSSKHENMTSALLVFLFFVSLYAFTMGGHLYSPDGEIMFRTTESIVERGETSIDPLEGFATKKGRNGKEYAQYGLGQSVLAVPFYCLGKGIAAIAGPEFLEAFRWDTIQYHERSVDSFCKRLGVSLYNTFVSAMLALLVYVCARGIYGQERPALCCALLYGGCTMAWPQARTFFSEPTAAMFLFAGFSILLLGQSTRLSFMSSGLCLGLSALTRLDSIVAFPALGLCAIFAYGTTRSRRSVSRLILFGLPIVVALAIICGYNHARYGSFFSTGYEDQEEGVAFATPILAGLYGLMLSPGKGLFVYSPVLVLLLWSFGKFLRMYPRAGWTLLGVVAAYVGVMSKWQNWAGGWCLGPRHIFQVHCFLTIPLGVLFLKRDQAEEGPPKAQGWRRKLGSYGVCLGWIILIAVSVFVQTLGVSASFMDAMQPLSEIERYMTLWVPNRIMPVLHWQLVSAGRADLWWAYFLKAPLGLWHLLAVGPPMGIILFGLALYRRLSRL